MLESVGRFIQELSLFTAVRESALVYPVLLSTHLTCIAIFGGLILVTNDVGEFARVEGLRLENWS